MQGALLEGALLEGTLQECLLQEGTPRRRGEMTKTGKRNKTTPKKKPPSIGSPETLTPRGSALGLLRKSCRRMFLIKKIAPIFLLTFLVGEPFETVKRGEGVHRNRVVRKARGLTMVIRFFFRKA